MAHETKKRATYSERVPPYVILPFKRADLRFLSACAVESAFCIIFLVLKEHSVTSAILGLKVEGHRADGLSCWLCCEQ